MNADTWEERRDHESPREAAERRQMEAERTSHVSALWQALEHLRRVRAATRVRQSWVDLDEAISATHTAVRVLSEGES